MKAAFTKVVRYNITAECVSPFRTGGDSGADSILADHMGKYIYQGSSMSGAMRAWVRRNFSGKEVALFGDKENEGSIIVSDGIFKEEIFSASRPRLRMNGKTGTVSNKAFFSTTYLPVKSTFDFNITWTGNEETSKELTDIVEKALSAINNGDIRLGGQKTNGFGNIKLTKAEKRIYDMTKKSDMEAWLNNSFDGATPVVLSSENTSEGLVKFTLTGYMESVLVRSSDKEGEAVINIKENGKPIIPGSSIKGVIRARVSKIAEMVGFDANIVDSIFGRESKDGDNGVSGVVRFNDVDLEGNVEKFARIRINRFTGATMRQALFSEKPHSGKVSIEVVVPESRKDACLLILYALRDMGISLYPIGSGRSVGRGYLRGETLIADISGKQKVVLNFKDEATCDIEDEAGILEAWRNACGKQKAEGEAN